jgi:WhiB family transcriptional regulator, redox-sensing transcriptional regulator
VNWRNLAACTSHPLSLFFDKEREKEAMAVCEACPVRAECLEDALEWQAAYDDGVTARSRRGLRRSGRKAVHHG